MANPARMNVKNPAESDAKKISDTNQIFKFPPQPPPQSVYGQMPASDTVELVREGDYIAKTEKLPATKSFAERKHFANLEKFEYARKGSDPGRVVIFSQEFFDPSTELSSRRGTKRDVNEILLCMQRLGFNITIDDVFSDLTAKEVQDQITKVAEDEERLSKTNCLIIFFLSHGTNSEEIYTKDISIKTSDIWKKFVECPALNRKPKMFIFQACKGYNYAKVEAEVSSPKEHKEEESESLSQILDIGQLKANLLARDMLLVYATIEGNVSYRSPLTGSWFIQELCKNFLSYGRRDDVLSILIRTTKCVCGNYYEYWTEIEKQLPVFVSTLTKKFYLNRNKDRDMLIDLQKKMDEVDRNTKEILSILKGETQK